MKGKKKKECEAKERYMKEGREEGRKEGRKNEREGRKEEGKEAWNLNEVMVWPNVTTYMQ